MRLAAETGTGGEAVIHVTDTGPGIPEAEIPTVLEPFGRGGDAHTQATEGAGLGLALVKTLTEVHGGSVAIDSRVGAGTRVTVRLPAAQAAATTAAPVAA